MRERLMHGAFQLSLACLLLAGCGAQSSGRATTASATPTATAMSPTAYAGTLTPAPLPPYTCEQAISQGAHVTQIGDIRLTDVSLSFLSYPSVMLPDNTPLTKPDQLHAKGPDTYATDFPGSPMTNPGSPGNAGAFDLVVCNTSQTQTHVLDSVTIKITSFEGYGGQLNAWRWCDNALDSHKQSTFYDCSGGTNCRLVLQASFPASATTGAEVDARQADCQAFVGPLPLALGPDKAVQISTTIAPPSAAGKYTFTFGLRLDGQTIYSAASPVVLLAPVAHHWSGLACQNSPAMLAQITPTNPETYYICPS
jgi:hypothetical protein